MQQIQRLAQWTIRRQRHRRMTRLAHRRTHIGANERQRNSRLGKQPSSLRISHALHQGFVNRPRLGSAKQPGSYHCRDHRVGIGALMTDYIDRKLIIHADLVSNMTENYDAK